MGWCFLPCDGAPEVAVAARKTALTGRLIQELMLRSDRARRNTTSYYPQLYELAEYRAQDMGHETILCDVRL